jgi:uncharacterized protein (TIGR03790 family)
MPKMTASRIAIFVFVLTMTPAVLSLEPDQILVIANGSNPASIKIAEYYCAKRDVPISNILKLKLDAPLDDSISRDKYNEQIASPIREILSIDNWFKCLLTVYGIPYKIERTGPKPGSEKLLADLNELADNESQIVRGSIVQLKRLGIAAPVADEPVAIASYTKLLIETQDQAGKALKRIKTISDPKLQKEHSRQYVKIYQLLYGKFAAAKQVRANSFLGSAISIKDQHKYQEAALKLNKAQIEKWSAQKRADEKFYRSIQQIYGFCSSLTELNKDIEILKGIETFASVDSELSMVMFDDYELYRQQPNELKERIFWFDVKTIMVSRLDGPSEKIARGLVEKAIAAERVGLKGNAYFDSGKGGGGLYDKFDGYIHDAAMLVKNRTELNVTEERTTALFQPGQCPDTVLYCGWYSLANYIDAFDFVVGAIGYHIASFEAIDLRNPQSTQWCPAMLRDGVTVTLGPVAEPYLHTFPRPDEFFSELLNGKQLVEAYYRTKPYNSWQMLLIGDPLYRPFAKKK